MHVKRAKKVFHPTNGTRKYILIEVKCDNCGRSRIVSSQEIEHALVYSSSQIKFKCVRCKGKHLSIHRQWFEFHIHRADIFPSW